MSQPNLPTIRVEVYPHETLGFVDDGFRDGWGTIGLGPASESFNTHIGDTGDYATHIVDSSGAEKRSAYEKDINPPFTLLTNTYGICRVRVWESVGEAQYFIFVIYTDATNTQSGWRNCTDAPEEYEMALAAGKTVDIIRLYIRAQDLASTVTVQWDYVMVISATPWVPTDITVGGVANQSLVQYFKHKARFRGAIVINDCRIRMLYDSTFIANYPQPGEIIFLYVATEHEHLTTYLQEKLFKGRVKKITHPTIDELTYADFYCVDLIEDIMDEVFSGDYEPTASTLSSIVTDIVDAVGVQANLNWWEMSRDSVRTTSNSIIKWYKNRPALDLINEIAHAAQFAGPIYGAIAYLDMGGDIHFEQMSYYSGQFGILETNITNVIMAEKSIDQLVNDVTIVYEPESVFPGDKNQWNETDEDGGGAPDYWNDSSGLGAWTIDGGDFRSGAGSTLVTFGVDPGSPETLGRGEVNRVNWFYADRIKFWIKRNVVWQAWRLHLVTAYAALGGAAYHQSAALAVPAVNTWVEYDLARTTFTRVNEPGDDVVAIEFVLTSAVGIGPGTIRFDKMRFIHDEKSANAASAGSKTLYGIHKKRIVNTNIKGATEAGYWATNLLSRWTNPRYHLVTQLNNSQNLAGTQGNMPYRPGNYCNISLRHTVLNLNAVEVAVMGTDYTYDARGADPWKVIVELGNTDVLPAHVPTWEERAKSIADLQRLQQDERSEIQWHR